MRQLKHNDLAKVNDSHPMLSLSQPWKLDKTLGAYPLENLFHQESLPAGKTNQQKWLAPEKTAYFFCDLHADAQAFLRSLKLSGLVTSDSDLSHLTLQEHAKTAQIIIGGDCFDKGPSNLQLFELLAKLRQENLECIILSGNHDLRVLAGILALQNPNNILQSHFVVRMGRKTVRFFKEIYDHYQLQKQPAELTNKQALKRLNPHPQWEDNFWEVAPQFLSAKQMDKELKQIAKKRLDMLEAAEEVGLQPYQLYQAIAFAHQLFVDPEGQFHWFLKELKLVHVSGSYLFCHAGIDDSIAKYFAQGADNASQTINLHFQNALEKQQLFHLYYNEFGNVVRTKYRNKDYPLTAAGAEYLKQQQIFAIVNGHRSHLDGQKLYLRQGLLNFECDTELNENCRKKSKLKADGESVTIFDQNGTVKAFCNDMIAPKAFDPRQLHALCKADFEWWLWERIMAKKTEYFEHESLQDTATVVGYLEALIEGIKAGKIEISDDEESQILSPNHLTMMNIKSCKTKKEQSLRIRLRWSHHEEKETLDTELSISSKTKKSKKSKK